MGSIVTITENLLPTKNAVSRFSVGCLFAGMGGFADAFAKSDKFRVAWANEINAHAVSTFRHRLPSVRLVHDDIAKINVSETELAPVDILIGGFPCQSFTPKGKKLALSDKKNGRAIYELCRLIREFSNDYGSSHYAPKIVVLENVMGLISHPKRPVRAIFKEFAAIGYKLYAKHILFCNVYEDTGVPQRRERVFLFAVRSDLCKDDISLFSRVIPEIPGIKKLVKDQNKSLRTLTDVVDIESESDDRSLYMKDYTTRYVAAVEAYNRHKPKLLRKGIDIDRVPFIWRHVINRPIGLSVNYAHTLTRNHSDHGTKDVRGFRILSVLEYAKFMGFEENENEIFPSSVPKTYRYGQLGNTVCPKLSLIVREICTRMLEIGA